MDNAETTLPKEQLSSQQPAISQTPISQQTKSQFKRHTAYKFQIGELLQGKQILDGERLHHLALNDKQIIRVNIIANVVDKFLTEGEKQYCSLTIDDATGQIRLKAFSEDVQKLSKFNQGDTILVIGLLRLWNNELYITPEILKKKDISYLLVRKLERETAKPKQLAPEQRIALKDKILQQIREAEKENGIDIDKIILSSKESPPSINQEIKRLLEEGMIYEPRPGKLRYLGA